MTYDYENLLYWAFLTREEWQFLYALQFAQEMLQMAPTRKLAQAFIDNIRHATEWYGYEFAAVEVDEHDPLVIHTKTEEPTCPENLKAIMLIQRGGTPDYDVHLPAAIEFVEKHEELVDYGWTLKAGLEKHQKRDDAHRQEFKQLPKEDLEVFEQMLASAKRDVEEGIN